MRAGNLRRDQARHAGMGIPSQRALSAGTDPPVFLQGLKLHLLAA